MKRKQFIALITLIISVIACIASSCTPEKISSEIKMPSESLAVQPDDSVPFLTGDMTYLLCENIDRGFRLETYFTLGSFDAWPGSGVNAFDYMNEMLEFYKEENVREIQVYVYLKEYYNRDIDEKALSQLNDVFEYFKEKKMGMILRFAYESEQNSEYAPSQKQMLRHIDTLGAWIRSNLSLWYETVTAFQLGMIGAWGEFGSSKVRYDREKIVNAVCAIIPENTYIQGRYVDVTALADEIYRSRIGYHNDFLVGRPHPWNTAGGDNDSEEYAAFALTNRFRLNDGEMPWAGATQEENEYVDGKNLIKQLYEHHMTTLSLEHNYREFIKGGNQPQQYYNIMRYRTETLSSEDVKAMGVPYYEEYFLDSEGTPVTHTVYEYIRDFIGYHLVLSDYVESNGTVTFTITNFGFGAPLNFRQAELVIIDGEGREKSFSLENYDPAKLCTYGQQTFTVNTKEALSGFSVGVRFNRSGGYCLRTANSVGCLNGINLLKKAF